MLEVENLSLNLGKKQILKDISFSLRPNRLTVLVGSNGSGKSSLLACINQQYPYSGAIREGGVDLKTVQPRNRARRIAILPQTLPAPHITARELVALGRNPYLDLTGRLQKTDREAVENALRLAQAEALAERYVDTLSGGEQQRAALAMILAQDTPILLLDEPTAHLDLRHQAAFLELLAGLGEKTRLLILHDLNLAARYADDLMVLEAGALRFAGSREECLERRILEKTFSLCRHTLPEAGGIPIFLPEGCGNAPIRRL